MLMLLSEKKILNGLILKFTGLIFDNITIHKCDPNAQHINWHVGVIQ